MCNELSKLNNRYYHFDVSVDVKRLKKLVNGQMEPGTLLTIQLVVPGEGDTERERVEIEVVVPVLGRHAKPEVHIVRRVLTEEFLPQAQPHSILQTCTSSQRSDSQQVVIEVETLWDEHGLYVLRSEEVTAIIPL